MKILVTAGNTWAPIDKVRVITNIFTGRTGAAISLHACDQGHHVTLLTSQPDVLGTTKRVQCVPYRTFDELRDLMAKHITSGSFDAVIHSAAVSDYLPVGVYRSANDSPASQLPPAGKLKSDESELWLRLVRAPKIVDQIRSEWHFRRILVKFKLEVAIDDKTLLDKAEQSRKQSDADLMVANTLEGGGSWAFLGPLTGHYQRIERPRLAAAVIAAAEHLHKERSHA